MPLRWLINPFAQISSHMPKTGNIVDLGCGEGVLAVLLAIDSPKRKVLGIDNNIDKINLGKSIAKNIPNLQFLLQDILKVKLTTADGFVLTDFIHHTPPKNHKEILENIAKATKKGGVLVIKEVDTSEFLRSKMARIWDFIFYPKDKTYYWHSKKLAKLLETLGYKVEIKRVIRYFPSSSTLFICKKI